MSISKATLERLPQYLRVLREKQKNNIKTISSTDIATELKLNPVQVRKDLAFVRKNEGKPKIGFEVNELINDIEEFLGLKNEKEVIIVGAGRLGQALMNYSGFENEIHILMAFDKDLKKCNEKDIFFIGELKERLKDLEIHVGIITVPKEEAQEVCDQMVECGIKAIWNFAPVNLKVPENVKIKNEDLSASLAVLLNGIGI